MIREKILRLIYQLKPFNLAGDLSLPLKPAVNGLISCLICTARKSDVIKNLLEDLRNQNLDKSLFEVIVLDNSAKGLKPCIDTFSTHLNIKYLRNTSQEGFISNLRNETLKEASGEYILFLDDDTRISQTSFLKEAILIFQESSADALLPYGKALESDKYPLDAYSFATRCCLYRRSILERLRGFHQDLTAYEDIDLGIRSTCTNIKITKTDTLNYQHPGLYFNSLRKPLAIGQSILKLKKYYPLHFWLVIYINSLRFLPLILIPTTYNQQWFKISWGALKIIFTNSTKYSYKN